MNETQMMYWLFKSRYTDKYPRLRMLCALHLFGDKDFKKHKQQLQDYCLSPLETKLIEYPFFIEDIIGTKAEEQFSYDEMQTLKCIPEAILFFPTNAPLTMVKKAWNELLSDDCEYTYSQKDNIISCLAGNIGRYKIGRYEDKQLVERTLRKVCEEDRQLYNLFSRLNEVPVEVQDHYVENRHTYCYPDFKLDRQHQIRFMSRFYQRMLEDTNSKEFILNIKRSSDLIGPFKKMYQLNDTGSTDRIIIKKEDFRSIILDSLSKHELTLKEVSQLLPDVDSSKMLMEMVK